MIILGIDPGTSRVGYGLIKSGPKPEFLSCGVLPKDEKGKYHLLRIEEELTELIKTFKPDCAAVEKLYFSKNKKTAFSVSEARGVILFTLEKNGVPIKEFTPSDVKSAVVGSGNSDKKSLQKIVALSLGLPEPETRDDAADALAIALRAAFERS